MSSSAHSSSRSDSNGTSKRPRVLIIGWDAADWKIAEPLVKAGRMPNLARLMKEGVYGNITTLYPPLSPTLWTSIATGKRPYKHGVLGFSEPTKEGRIRPCSVLSRKTKAVWNILAQNGMRSVVVGWWPSHPAEPIPGAMVSNHFQQVEDTPGAALPPLPKGMVHPPELREAIADLRVRPWEIPLEVLRMFVPKVDQVDQMKDKSVHSLARILSETLSIHAAATELIETTDWDLAAVYFDTIDHVGHRFMRYHPPRLPQVPEAEFALYNEIITNTYRHHDAMLGRYLELAGPDVHVIVLSDHGFHSDERRPEWIPAEPAGPAVEHRRLGMFVMAGPGISAGQRIHGCSILDVTPTVLTLMGLPIGDDMDGKPLIQAWIDRPLVKHIPSWDAVEGEDGRHTGEVEQDPASAAAELEQLIALGYVSPLPDNRMQAVRETVRELDYNKARAFADGGLPQEALPLLENLWKEWPDEHRFGLHLMDVYGWCGRIRERRETLDLLRARALELAKRSREALARLVAEDKEQAGKPSLEEDAIAQHSPEQRRKAFERRQLMERAAGLDLVRAEIGQALLEGDRESALRQIDDLLAGRECAPALVPFLANALFALGRVDSASKLLDLLEAEDPENPFTYGLRAEMHFRAGNVDAAIEAAAQSLGLAYFNPPLHTLLALALQKAGRREDAINQLRVSLQQNPSYLPAIQALEALCAQDPELAFTLGSWRETIKARLRSKHAAVKAGPSSRQFTDYDFSVLCGTPALNLAPLQPDEMVIVSGLPRSGTSMLMRALKAGGITLLEDGERKADENNRLGYFEFERVKTLSQDISWLGEARGKAVKIVAPLLPNLPMEGRARVIVLHRPLNQIIASQESMKQRLGTDTRSVSSDALQASFGKMMARIDEPISSRSGWTVLHVSYEAMLSDPSAQARRIAAFLGGGFDANAAALSVDPAQRRFK